MHACEKRFKNKRYLHHNYCFHKQKLGHVTLKVMSKQCIRIFYRKGLTISNTCYRKRPRSFPSIFLLNIDYEANIRVCCRTPIAVGMVNAC